MTKSLLTKTGESREKWRPIPSLPEYLASNYGRIMMVPALVNTTDGKRVAGGLPRVGEWTGERYIFRFRGKTYKVARLVCEAFHGPAPASKPICMHLDEDASNNRPENLAWGTQKENLNAPGFIKYCHGRTGENSPSAKARKKAS